MTAKAFAPVTVATQVKRHRIANKNFKPVPVQVQKKRHQAALKAAKTKKAAKHHRAKKHGAAVAADQVACCVAEAVAQSLELTIGERVNVLALHAAAGGDDREGATIPDVLAAVQRPRGPVPGGVILGLDTKFGPHAVLAFEGLWWSWGEPYEPWDARITEAWELSWRP